MKLNNLKPAEQCRVNDEILRNVKFCNRERMVYVGNDIYLTATRLESPG